MNRLVQLRNQITEAYQSNQTDLAFELEETYNDYTYESSEAHRIKQQYDYAKRSQVIA